ncbi:MAG: exodeoxyribonuclease III [Akkermansiaceae bacterium]|nr:exodeoxyribonuclease III [Akkermansiaceae bacterium]
MKLLSWNVNGIRAVLNKGAIEPVLAACPDILCLQETKAHPEQVELPLEFGAYKSYWNAARKKGYSGTAIFTREPPLDVINGMGIDEHDGEGRVIAAEYPDFVLVNVYTPNAQDGLRRLGYRLEWDAAFRSYLKHLEKTRGKPVVWCGDLNVAHEEIDIARPRENRKSAGFSDEERASFTDLLKAGFTDTFRQFYPDQAGAYTWWSFRSQARARNVGWRIDYFGVSDSFMDRVKDATIHADIEGSDHCPVGLELA